jgi:ABC-2 type transport system permease protein
MSMEQIKVVAENEFTTIIKKPIVLVFIFVVFVLFLIEAIGSSMGPSMLMQKLLQASALNPEYMILRFCLGNSFFNTSFLFCILSMCIGVFSIADERSRGGLQVLMCKPLYRRDIIIGKVLGISGLLALTITFVLTVFTSISIILYPFSLATSFLDITIRMMSYMLVLLLLCVLTLTITMTVGLLFRNVMSALTLSMALLYIQWYSDIPNVLGVLGVIDPERLYIYAIETTSLNIFDSMIPYSNWLSGALPYIGMIIAEIVIITLINCILLNRESL